MSQQSVLTFFCGKMGAGKSTQAKLLAAKQNAVLISEDDWLALLYPQKINNFEDYLIYSRLLKPLIKKHVQNILTAGANVVLDFPANLAKQRAWYKEIAQEVNATSHLVYINLTDEVCLRQVAQRRQEQPERAAFDNEAVFHQVVKFFEAPLITDVDELIER